MTDQLANHDMTLALLRAHSKGLAGWALVDAMMQRQLEAGVTTVEAWTRHLEESGLMDSWLAWSADRENPDLQKLPSAKWSGVTVDRWEVDAKWEEAIDEFQGKCTGKFTPWRELYGALLQMRIREPGLLLRHLGIPPAHEDGTRRALTAIGRLTHEEKKRIARGDDVTLLGALSPNASHKESNE